MTTANRAQLLSRIALTRPALATQSFIPAWTHIRLERGYARSFNDTTSIEVKTGVSDLPDCCVAGELFIKALSSFKAETVMLQETDDAASMQLVSGKSRLKVPTLPIEDFKMPVLKGTPHSVDLYDSVLEGIKRCLFAVGTDPTHPAQMGVTLSEVDGKAVLYSTDNITLSRYATKTPLKLPGDAPVILPTFFCEQLLALDRALPELALTLDIYSGALVVRFGKNEASLLTKTLADTNPLDFEEIFDKHLPGFKNSQLTPIPDPFDAAFNRALLVLSNETDKSVKVTVSKNGDVEMLARSAAGESHDEFVMEKTGYSGTFHVDPALVLRAAKTTGFVAFLNRVVVMSGMEGAFTHLIAHTAG